MDPEKAAEAIRAAVHTGAMEVDLEALGCYIEPRIYSGDETLKALCDTMNQCREMEITYIIGEESQVLPAWWKSVPGLQEPARDRFRWIGKRPGPGLGIWQPSTTQPEKQDNFLLYPEGLPRLRALMDGKLIRQQRQTR